MSQAITSRNRVTLVRLLIDIKNLSVSRRVLQKQIAGGNPSYPGGLWVQEEMQTLEGRGHGLPKEEHWMG